MPRVVSAAAILLALGLPLWKIVSISPVLFDEVTPSDRDVHDVRSVDATVDSSFQPIWPTNASRRINSSFAEFRRTHFHGGIDISTNNRTGYPVYAAEHGFVASVEVSPSGYGKVVFLQHPNGYVSVYAHLKMFNDLINSVVEELQQREGKYAVRHRFDPGDIIVRKGELIAFTGDTGRGSAHLHFEIRDQNFNPLNPLLFQTLRPVDKTPPIIRRLAASPLNSHSTVGGDHEPKVFTAKRKSKNLYELSSPLYATGDIGLAVEARDRLDGSWRNVGIHRVELFVDDERLFACEYNRILVRQTKQVALHFDWPLLAQHRRRYRKLYVEPGDGLGWYNPGGASAGVLSTHRFKAGPHPFRIVCTDIEGNSTELRGTLILNHRPSVRVVESYSPLVLEFEEPNHVKRIHLSGRSLAQKAWVTSTFDRRRTDAATKSWQMPPLRQTFDLLKIVAEDQWGTRSAPYFYFLRKPTVDNRSITIEKKFVRDFVVVTVATDGHFTAVPLLQVYQSGQVSQLILRARNEREYSGAFRPFDEVTGPIRLRARAEVNGSWTEAEEDFTVYPIAPREDALTVYDDGDLVLTALPQATYETVFCRVEKQETAGRTTYALLPDDQLLNSGVRVTLKVGEQFKRFEKVGLYIRSGGKWQFVRSEKDSIARTVSTTVQRTLGEVALQEDLEAPKIHSLRIRTSRTAEISFRLSDDRSGVDADAIEMYIDDELMIPEYEEETHRVMYAPKKPFGKGSHRLLISVLDRVGNQTTLTRTFRSIR